MRGTFPLGTVAGVRVLAHWSALGLAALIVALLGGAVLPRALPGAGPGAYWTVALAAGILFMAALLVHELAHAVVARRCGLKVGSITLWGLGGFTELEEQAETPRVELAVAAAGPLTSLGVAAVGFLVYLVLPRPALPASAVAWLAGMNLLLGVFNLLPGAPLDGGRVLHALLWWRFRDVRRADRGAEQAGRALGMALIAIGVFGTLALGWFGGLWLLVLGWFIIGAARQELTVKVARSGLRDLSVRDVMTPDPERAAAWVTVEEFADQVALNSRQTDFPVVSFAGTPIGVVSLAALASVPPERRGATRVDSLDITRRPMRVVAPDDDATSLIERPALRQLIVVVEEGRLVGMVTGADLERILRQAFLRADRPGP
ncbi:site-2 protease family protein [Spongiactinospora sp. TRM90649]|uniref:site-2 protease family protein n=1 Tax=Spongiactinospora sp. TRM90649 TaxID=3031114 RepID=UPI0023F8301A|nr:site-2 protease family protein [Spongiactinospora sp. TRM90649]MDF5755079.1 site-2 protease family protein [Spongiactinospora sp. TRM90649]